MRLRVHKQRAFYSLHALLEDRVPPGLADDQIGPLHDDDADKEGRVAGELHDLPLLVSLMENTSFASADDGTNCYLRFSLQMLLTHCCP